MTNRIAAGAATLSCVLTSLLVSAAARAADMPQAAAGPPTANVAVADLDLASPQGSKALQQRIEGAAAGMCLTTGVEPLDVRIARSRCYRAAVADGKRKADGLIALRGDRAATGTQLAMRLP
jgi:UrcA family protein